MPYKMRKVDGYQVRSPHGVKAKHTTRAKGISQMRLLRMKEHGVTPKGGWRKK